MFSLSLSLSLLKHATKQRTKVNEERFTALDHESLSRALSLSLRFAAMFRVSVSLFFLTFFSS
jgi:hypothetical protein